MANNNTTVEQSQSDLPTATIELNLAEIELALVALNVSIGDAETLSLIQENKFVLTEAGLDALLLVITKLTMAAEPLIKEYEAKQEEDK